MFYEKLAEKKQDRSNRKLTGGQLASAVVGGGLGGAAGFGGTFYGIQRYVDKHGELPEFLGGAKERRALAKKYEELNDKYYSPEETKKRRAAMHADFDKLYKEIDEKVPADDFLKDRTADVRARYDDLMDKGEREIRKKYINNYAQDRLKEMATLNKKYDKRARIALATPLLLGTAAGAYGAKKLYDKYRGNQQSKG